MAIASPGPLVAGISGTVGSCVFRGRGGGCVVSQSPVIRRSGSVAALAARARLQMVETRWGALSAGEKREWDAFGQRLVMGSGNGPVRHPSGRAVYLRHMLRWAWVEYLYEQVWVDEFPGVVPEIEWFRAEAGVSTGVSVGEQTEDWIVLAYLARSHSMVGWTRVCWRYVAGFLLLGGMARVLPLRVFQLPVMGEFGVGELVKLRLQWLLWPHAITPEPVEYETVVT